MDLTNGDLSSPGNKNKLKRYDLINLCSSMIVHAHAKTRARAKIQQNIIIAYVNNIL